MADEVIVHHGAPIRASGLPKDDEAFLAAVVRGEFGADDEEDTGPQLIQRARLMHVFLTDPEDVELGRWALEIFGVEPDDEATGAMVDGWLREIYGAAPFPSASAVEGLLRRWLG